MPIEFKSVSFESRFLDPRQNFEAGSLSFEIRQDPLTELPGFVAKYRLPLFEKPDLSELVRCSLLRECPFCPQNIQTMTPQFPHELINEGRLHLGEAWVIPNLSPVAQYSAVTIVSNNHFVPITDFSEDMLTDAFVVSKVYLEKVLVHDSQVKYCSINCNYMPLAGSGQLHPHLQVIANRFPTTYEKQMLEASRKYCETNSTNFWADLIDEEKRLGQRYVGTTGNCCWMMTFVPRGFFEAMAIFQERTSILELTSENFRDFAVGLRNVLNYINDMNLYGFNMAVYSGERSDNSFWVNARVVPRFLSAPLNTSDVNFGLILHDLPLQFNKPEDICSELKPYFIGT